MVKFYNQYFRDNQPLLFIFVGALNTLFGYTIFTFFIMMGLHYALAALLANILGVLFNFKTTGKIVFKNSNNVLLVKFFLRSRFDTHHNFITCFPLFNKLRNHVRRILQICH